MKAVIQRATETTVRVDDTPTAHITHGLVAYICLEKQDTYAGLEPVIDTIVTLELFGDEGGQMKKTVGDARGSIVIVPQFTLAATFTRGRPSFDDAMPAVAAKELFEQLLSCWKKRSPVPVEAGEFGANMQIQTTQNGPVTVLLEW